MYIRDVLGGGGVSSSSRRRRRCTTCVRVLAPHHWTAGWADVARGRFVPSHRTAGGRSLSAALQQHSAVPFRSRSRSVRARSSWCSPFRYSIRRQWYPLSLSYPPHAKKVYKIYFYNKSIVYANLDLLYFARTVQLSSDRVLLSDIARDDVCPLSSLFCVKRSSRTRKIPLNGCTGQRRQPKQQRRQPQQVRRCSSRTAVSVYRRPFFVTAQVQNERSQENPQKNRSGYVFFNHHKSLRYVY